MNANQAKQIKMEDLMAKLGYEVKVVERGGTEKKYMSPFRAEVEPSFNVNIMKNVWYDFGAAQGSNTLEFAIAYLASNGKPSDVSSALKWLDDLMGNTLAKSPSLFPAHQINEAQSSIDTEAPKHLIFVKDSPLRSEVILKYLAGRRISPQIAKKYLRVVQYRNTSKNASDRLYFGFAQKNISKDGWEVRSCAEGSGKFKSALNQRDITVHSGSDKNKSKNSVSVFEGMLDHLSLLELIGVDQLRGDSIVMNALSSYERTKAYILEKGYSRIDLFLDNNDSGRKATAKFKEDFGDIVFDHSPSYFPHVDLNDCLVAGDTPSFDVRPTPPQP